jgi:small subunit ribosomal protein S8
MVINDPIGDMLTRIRNAALAHKQTVELPTSMAKLAVAKLLVKEGFLTTAAEEQTDHGMMLQLTLAYEGKEPVLTGVKRISKPGLRWYIGKKKIPMVMGGMGIAIVSTPQGVMSGKDARTKGIGGELLCEVW